jgi:RNA polymerase sigma-70 factor (ECF subfamily)
VGALLSPSLVGAAEERDVPVRAPVQLTPVERLRRGEPDALAEAYDRHHARLRTFAQRMIGDDAAAEDLVQEVFVTLPAAIRRFREGASLESFLIAIAINHARHHVRAATRRRRALERLQREPDRAHETPERRASGRQLADALVRALDQLPIDQRIAFVLLEVEERTSAEAALLVGVPEATMRTRLHHARRQLRELLAREYHEL